MSVNILYCEGGRQSFDIRVLSKILEDACTLETMGSKYGFENRVILVRKLQSKSVIAGLKDRDFDDDNSPPQLRPREWFFRDNQDRVQIGWSWERKEIENYLIDPEVVRKSLGKKAPPLDEYCEALKKSAEAIADYTAARIALSLSRVQLLPLNNNWGEKRWGFIFPESLTEADCRQQICQIVKDYEQSQTIQEAIVLNKFDEFLSTCRPGGVRFENQNYLTFFAGKDLLGGMQAALNDFGLGTPSDFRERIIVGINKSPEDVWTWLPEWGKLRELIRDFNSDPS